ncbi:hypothetical protein THAOC_15009 [Thalassiosira oceanica]|uniref:Uncharacterized protein n=1 Tax=Thalassiosira oceanica TaxID=159749 RepID=K0SDW5_THAOC|nr:hypothetical protein THAOC_15009 [Thalassiosira oceanica]|eukprot:EJK64273.1 hypothetical protein THAOC_15009 [Thalassiosira oceanica]
MPVRRRISVGDDEVQDSGLRPLNEAVLGSLVKPLEFGWIEYRRCISPCHTRALSERGMGSDQKLSKGSAKPRAPRGAVDRRGLRGAWPRQAHIFIFTTEACEKGTIWRSGRKAIFFRRVGSIAFVGVQFQLCSPRLIVGSLRDLAGDVFYTREELRVMNNVRFDDASKLRKKMFGEKSQSIAQDDSILSRKSTAGSTNQLFSDIINDRDEWDANISLDGIEPFVFLELRDEMVKKRANVRKEIIDFVKANKSDPQGWRLASHSRFHTQWARNIAQEKARALHEVLLDESKHPSKKSEPEKLKEGQDLLDGSIPVRFRDSAPTPSPRRSWAGRRPQRRASICGPSAVSAPVSNLSQLSPSKEVGTPAPDDKAQLQQSTKTFSLSESDDDDDDGGGAPDPSPRSPLFCGLWTSWM